MKISAEVRQSIYVQFELNPNEDFDTLLKEFNETIFETDKAGLIDFICGQLTSDPYFIEGIGPVEYSNGLNWEFAQDETVLLYNTYKDEQEVEVHYNRSTL